MVNTAPVEISDWATISVGALPAGWGERMGFRRESGAFRFWLDRLPAHSVQAWHAETPSLTDDKLDVKLDALGWPISCAWPGMKRPLFEGGLGDFLNVSAVPPADRNTIARLHGNADTEKREAIRRTALRESAAAYGPANAKVSPHTVVYQQEIRHERLVKATRRLELWRREPRARLTVRFDRVSSLAPEVFFLSFALPQGSGLPVFSSGGVPFTPYRDQLPGSCRDYFGIDGWAHYPTGEGHWLWVTRDAPLVAVGSPHVGELHQLRGRQPRDHGVPVRPGLAAIDCQSGGPRTGIGRRALGPLGSQLSRKVSRRLTLSSGRGSRLSTIWIRVVVKGWNIEPLPGPRSSRSISTGSALAPS